jgi:hypothetical protein
VAQFFRASAMRLLCIDAIDLGESFSEMKFLWIKLLVLSSFTFWGSGLAKHVHEAMEHHGHDASIEDDDDDDCGPVAKAGLAEQPSETQPAKPKKSPCPVCQMLAAMTVHHSPPPDFPITSELSIGTATVVDRIAPTLHACFALSARDPPVVTFHF